MKHQQWFKEGCLELLDQRKEAKLQWLRDPGEINEDNLNSIRHETSRHFRNKKKEYLQKKIDEFATNTKNKNIRELYRGINEFNRGYQPRSNLVKDENGDLLENYFSQILNVHRVSDVRQLEIHTAELLVPGPSRFELKLLLQN
jgi:hypothetical protein